MSDIIKFNLKELEKLNTPFFNYILGRSLFGLKNELDADKVKGDTILKYTLPKLLQMQNDKRIEQNEMVYATFVESSLL